MGNHTRPPGHIDDTRLKRASPEQSKDVRSQLMSMRGTDVSMNPDRTVLRVHPTKDCSRSARTPALASCTSTGSCSIRAAGSAPCLSLTSQQPRMDTSLSDQSISFTKFSAFFYRALHQIFLNSFSAKSSRFPMHVCTLFVLILALGVGPVQCKSIGLCRGVPCANGGRLLVDNSVWGHCRCRCPSGFAGPYCQYQLAGKRSLEKESNLDNRVVGHSDTLERIRQRLLSLMKSYSSSAGSRRRRATAYDDDDDDVEGDTRYSNTRDVEFLLEKAGNSSFRLARRRRRSSR